jgi:8-amino-7-oxononanoate synthase
MALTGTEGHSPPPPPGPVDIFAKCISPRVEVLRAVESMGMAPWYLELGSEVGPTVTFGDRELIMLGSNNYLGLTADPRVKAAAIAAVERFGTGCTGSRLLNGTLVLHRQLEEELADWLGTEACLVFTTGYTANLGLISTVVQAPDAVFLDSQAHASLVDGARLSEGSLRAFRHNRPNSLRRGLRSWRDQGGSGGVLVAVDGIYSMEGDEAPLSEIHQLCTEFGARLLVDEAHGIGVTGPAGAGCAAAAGIRPDLVMGTFSKSLASCGGFIAGSRDVIDFLRVECRPLMFTASGVPAALGATLAAVRVARTEDWRREVIVALVAQLRAGLTDLGYDVGPPAPSAIVAIRLNSDWDAGILWNELVKAGVYTNCAVPPAVHKAILRTSVMATHTAGDIDRALVAFEATRSSVGLA